MNRRLVTLLSVALTAPIAAASPAHGAPPGAESRPPEVFSCDGVETAVFGGAGRSGWLDGTLYVATEIHVSGTFTPAGGDPEPFRSDKIYGDGPSGDPVVCQHQFERIIDGGTAVGETVIIAVLVPGHEQVAP